MPKKKPLPPPPELETLPSRILYARKRIGMTGAALAEAAQMDPSQISRLEHGERMIGIEAATIIRLARALGVPVGWLAADEGAPPTQPPVFRETDRRRKVKSN